MAVGGGGEEGEMEKDFEAKLRVQQGGGSVQRTNSIAFRAPQEQFSINDFELGRIYGVGSYSKVRAFVFLSDFFGVFSLWMFEFVRFVSWVCSKELSFGLSNGNLELYLFIFLF